MEGTNRTASIATRSGGGWVDAGTTWTCRIQPISPTTVISDKRYFESTHMCVGEPTPVIEIGNRLTISGEMFYVAGAQMMNRPGYGNFSQEIYITAVE